jgi:hypothetical protein
MRRVIREAGRGFERAGSRGSYGSFNGAYRKLVGAETSSLLALSKSPACRPLTASCARPRRRSWSVLVVFG